MLFFSSFSLPQVFLGAEMARGGEDSGASWVERRGRLGCICERERGNKEGRVGPRSDSA